MILPKTILDIHPHGKKALVRVDYNVPLGEAGEVKDSTKLVESLPTLDYLLKQGASILLMSHLGRPGGKRDAKLSLRALVPVLSKLLNRRVQFVEDCIGAYAEQAAKSLKPGEILLLENLRFHAEEEKNSLEFAKALANLGDFFVNDAFASAHRAHASTVGVTRFLPSVAGFLLEKELHMLSGLLLNAKHPYWAVLGGAKVSDKIKVIRNLLPRVDRVLLGGAMAFSFLKVQGFYVGNSRVEKEMFEEICDLLKTYPEKIKLPSDCVACETLENPASRATVLFSKKDDTMHGLKGVDIGEKTIRNYAEFIIKEKPSTIFWNGPLGVFEIPEFSHGTLEMAKILGKCAKEGTTVVVGGGDSIAAVNQLALSRDITYLSTGGGATLEFLEGKSLPGVEALCNSSLKSNADSTFSR